MHGNNPTRDYIEAELTRHAADGRIRSWQRLTLHYSGAPKWRVTFNEGVTAGPQSGVTSLSEIEIRTYQEGKLICAALASAELAARDAPVPASAARDALLHGRTQEQLRDAFARVRNPQDWKLPVDTLIRYGDPWAGDASRALIDAAVVFYTGSMPAWVQTNAGWHVTAAGYYTAIGS